MIYTVEELDVGNLYLDNISNELSHLTGNELLQLIYDYKSDLTVKEILKKYKIETSSSKLKKLLPLIFISICEHCHGKILYELKSKSYGGDLLEKQSGICIECNHRPNSYGCQCEACIDCANEQKKKEEAKKKIKLLMKKEVIEKKYNFDSSIPEKEINLGLRERIFLSVIVRCCLSEDGKYIKPIGSSLVSLTPCQELTTKIIQHLTSANILVPSPESDVDAFVFDEKNELSSYYIYEVKYLLNIESKDKYSFLVERLMYPEIDVHEFFEEFLEIWKELALYECLDYLIFQMKEVGYNFSVGNITKTTFEKLLQNFSVGQIYNLIFRAVANSTRAYQSGKYTKTHAMNIVVASCRSQGEKAIAERWDLKAYSRIKQLPESELSRLLFTVILKKSNQGFDSAPTLENLVILDALYE